MRKKLCLILSLGLMFSVSASATLQSAAAEVSAKSLHRADFRLEKASCATCIMKVRKALRALPGVIGCEIALRKPYGAVVIFEANKVTVEAMKKAAHEADPNKRVECVDVLDRPIPKVPSLLLPMYSALKQP